MQIYLIVVLCCVNFQVLCQVPPICDDGWILNTALSDEFDMPLDNNKWGALSSGSVQWDDESWFSPGNVYTSNDNLLIKLDKPHAELPFRSGLIKTHHELYSYGYLEISAELPGYDSLGVPTGYGFWPQFWTSNIDHDNMIHEEIDIVEPSGSQYKDGSTNVVGWHEFCATCPSSHSKVSGHVFHQHSSPLFNGFHKYALEWLPNRIIFYFDDEIIYEEYYDVRIPKLPQIIWIGVGGDDFPHKPDTDTPWPLFMTVEYFRYYNLVFECETPKVIPDQATYDSFNFAVKENIEISNGNSPITLNSTDRIALRASDYISIDGDFTVPLGAVFSMVPTPCP